MRRVTAVIAVLVLALVTARFLPSMVGRGGGTPAAIAVRSADLLMQDRPDGSIEVRDSGNGLLVDTVPPASNGFLRVILAGQVRERRREGIDAPSRPFHLTRWSDGRLTLDDDATHRLIELNAFGPDNAGAFARLLDLTPPAASPAPAQGSRPAASTPGPALPPPPPG